MKKGETEEKIWKVIYAVTGYSTQVEEMFGLADSAEEAARKAEEHLAKCAVVRQQRVLGRKVKKGEPQIFWIVIRSITLVGEVGF